MDQVLRTKRPKHNKHLSTLSRCDGLLQFKLNNSVMIEVNSGCINHQFITRLQKCQLSRIMHVVCCTCKRGNIIYLNKFKIWNSTVVCLTFYFNMDWSLRSRLKSTWLKTQIKPLTLLLHRQHGLCIFQRQKDNIYHCNVMVMMYDLTTDVFHFSNLKHYYFDIYSNS